MNTPISPQQTGSWQTSPDAVLRAQRQTVPASQDTAAKRPGPLAGLCLLLAEDNPVNQQTATELLSRQGALVEVVEDGRLAVDRVVAGSRYDAVLMDVQMPVMDGLAATRALRKSFDANALPVIAMTASAMDTDREACFEAGMNELVAKPLVITDVVAVVLRCIARSRAEPATPAAPPPRVELPVFDRADALARMGEDDQLLRTVLPVFRANLQGALRDLAGFESSAPGDLARLMHSIKGMAANLAAKALAAEAAAAEQQLRTEPGAPHGAAVQRVTRAISAVLREIRTER